MKVLIVISCLAFVASAFPSDPQPPASIIGSLLRTKGNLFNDGASRWDRWMANFRGLSPFGITATSTAAPTTTVAAAIPSTSASIIVVDCKQKPGLVAKLAQAKLDLAASKLKIGDATSGLTKNYADKKAAVTGTITAVMVTDVTNALQELNDEKSNQSKFESLIENLTAQLESYKSCL